MISLTCWNAGVRIAKKVKFASKSKTTIEAIMKASIKAYGVAITAEELVKTDVTALPNWMMIWV